jgi:hypothetical protein
MSKLTLMQRNEDNSVYPRLLMEHIMHPNLLSPTQHVSQGELHPAKS